jgi:hypothetical protein
MERTFALQKGVVLLLAAILVSLSFTHTSFAQTSGARDSATQNSAASNQDVTLKINDYMNALIKALAILHPGGVPGSAAMITRYPEDKLLIVMLSNLQDSRIIRASSDLGAIVLGEKYDLPKVRTAIEISAKVLEPLAGDYEDRPGRVTRILVANGTLKLQLAANAIGQIDPIPMSAESETEFFDPFNDTQVVFVKDAGGQVTEMILRINGREFHARKIK